MPRQCVAALPTLHAAAAHTLPNCHTVTAEDVNSNLNAARTFAIFTFLAALLIVYAAVQAWRQAGAHPFPKLAFIASLLNVLFIIVTVGAYANWFAYEVVHDEQKVGNSPTAHWIGSACAVRCYTPSFALANPHPLPPRGAQASFSLPWCCSCTSPSLQWCS